VAGRCCSPRVDGDRAALTLPVARRPAAVVQEPREMSFLPVTAGRCQLIATLGPASFDLAPALAEAGATALRLNASHMDAAELRSRVRQVRAALPDVPLVVDLQGAKMRLGRFDERRMCAGERVVFAFDAAESGAIPLPHAPLFSQTRPGETLSMDDGRLRFKAIACDRDRLEAEALAAGALRPRKGVNVVEHPVVLDDLTPADLDALVALAGIGNVAWAFSFMVDGREAEWVRRRQTDAVVIGKIERREAVAQVLAMAGRCDGLWLCRGDLGAQLGMAEMARRIAAIEPRRLSRPILMAGQVLEHLTQHAEPTRSEVCHVFDVLARRFAGIVLSDETAIGIDPIKAVRVAAGLVAAASP
jgi:pyruvate kinase